MIRRGKMTRMEFESAVEHAGIDQQSFSLDGGLLSEQYVLSKNGSCWSVYYRERGLRSGLQVFDLEEDALDCLFNWLWSDTTTRRP